MICFRVVAIILFVDAVISEALRQCLSRGRTLSRLHNSLVHPSHVNDRRKGIAGIQILNSAHDRSSRINVVTGTQDPSYFPI